MTSLAASVTLREINADTVRAVTRLAVGEQQTRFVAPNAVSLAQALFAPEAWYRAIHAGDELAGFVMLYDESLRPVPPERPEVGVWRFMVDARFQGRGIGRAAMRQVIEHVRARGCFDKLELSFVPGPGTPEPFYLGLGFRHTGRVDDGEVVLEYSLKHPFDGAPQPDEPPDARLGPSRAGVLLETGIAGCRLRPWQAGDLPALVHHANNHKVWRNLTETFPHPYTEADARGWFETAAQPGPGTHLAIEFDGEAIGGIGIAAGGGIACHTGQFGYWLGEAHWGKGIATAAARAMAAHAFAAPGFERLEAPVFLWNPASMRVLEKAGFEREGVLRRSVFKDGQLIDSVLYARVRYVGPGITTKENSK